MYYRRIFKVKGKVVLQPKWPHSQSLDTFHLPVLAGQTSHFMRGIPNLKTWLYASSLNFFKNGALGTPLMK